MTAPAFHGIIPPLVTPLDDQQQLDYGGLERLVERLIEGGVHGLFVLGTTGEGPSLPLPLQHQVVATVCDQVANRLPVVVGISNTVARYSRDVAEEAYAAGASALVLAPPYYLPMTQSELRDYVERLAEQLPLPVMLYNMPSCCKTWFDVDTVEKLSQLPQVCGIKDSSGDLQYLQQILSRLSVRPDFSVLIGPEELLVPAMRAGAQGGVTGGANLFPRLYATMYQAATNGDWTRADQLQQQVHEVSRLIYQASEGPSAVVKGIKTALELLGVCSDQMAEPFMRHTADARQAIRRHLELLLPALGSLADLECPAPQNNL